MLWGSSEVVIKIFVRKNQVSGSRKIYVAPAHELSEKKIGVRDYTSEVFMVDVDELYKGLFVSKEEIQKYAHVNELSTERIVEVTNEDPSSVLPILTTLLFHHPPPLFLKYCKWIAFGGDPEKRVEELKAEV